MHNGLVWAARGRVQLTEATLSRFIPFCDRRRRGLVSAPVPDALDCDRIATLWLSASARRPHRTMQSVTPILYRFSEFRRGWARLSDYCRSKTDRVLTVVPSGLLIT
jgi:hypothetical protein